MSKSTLAPSDDEEIRQAFKVFDKDMNGTDSSSQWNFQTRNESEKIEFDQSNQ
jgi:hypothetical protein